MGRIGCAVGVDGMVGIAVVGDDDDLIARGASSLDGIVNTAVNGLHGLGDGTIHAGVTHHVAVSIVHHNEVVLVLADGGNELVAHLIGAHLGFQVIGGHVGRRHQDAVLVGKGLLAATAEEEGHMGILLGLGDVQLALALA